MNTSHVVMHFLIFFSMFDAYPDSVLPDVTHYSPSQTLPLLKNTVSFAHEVLIECNSFHYNYI